MRDLIDKGELKHEFAINEIDRLVMEVKYTKNDSVYATSQSKSYLWLFPWLSLINT